MSRTFFRKFLPAVPRAAGRLPPSGALPSAATSSVLYAPPPRRGRETLPHTGCRQLQRGGAEGDGGDPGREGAPELAFLLGPDAGPPRGPGASPRPIDATARRPGACAPRPSGAAGLAASVRAPARPARGAARFPPSGTPPKKKYGRLRGPPAFRAGRPSATVPGRFSLYLYIGMLSSDCRKCA